MSAPYTGGFVPGSNQLFAVDGDFTQCDPCGMPVMSFPVKGDSILSLNDIIIFDQVTLDFVTVKLGIYPNIHPWSPNQQVMVLEQDFMVAQNSYFPMPLNTPYNVSWSLGFQNSFPSGYPSAQIGDMYLVEEGELQDVGGGISKIRRKWATLPPVRCEIEQYAATFPGLETSDGTTRPAFTKNVMFRIQYDYFIFDDLGILMLPIFPAGYLLNSATGLYPSGLIIPAQQYFSNKNVQSNLGVYIGNTTDYLNDGTPDDPVNTATVPSATNYLSWCLGSVTSNQLTAEIVAESSTMTRWMGNIWERRTRFVLAQ